MARRWTVKERVRQSMLIRDWRPWDQSTGPKTLEGKSRSSRNAFKGDPLEKLLRQQEALVKQASELHSVYGLDFPDVMASLVKAQDILELLKRQGVTSADLLAIGFRC